MTLNNCLIAKQISLNKKKNGFQKSIKIFIIKY